jgi:hypothetical protein
MRKYKCPTCGLVFEKTIKIIDRYDNESDGCPNCREECLGWADEEENRTEFEDY